MEKMSQKNFKPGDRVVFCMVKHKSHPSRLAQGVQPAANGDSYSFYVRKFWVVSDVFEDGRLQLRTPRGKERVVDADDPSLTHASLLDKILHRDRFIQSETAVSPA